MTILGIKALAKHIQDRLESKKSRTIFESGLARVWPVGPVVDLKRAERIQAFAKTHGWSATIYDLRVVFRKLTP